MIQYVAILASAVVVALLLAKPELVKPLAATVAVSSELAQDVPIGSLSQSPVGQPVSVTGVLMKVERESKDAVLLTFADSSGSVGVPYLDTDNRTRVFEVGTVYRVTGIVVGKKDGLFLVPQHKTDIERTLRSPSELLKRKAVEAPVVEATPPPPAPQRATGPRPGHYVVLASTETRQEADLLVAEFSRVSSSQLLIVPIVVNSETRFRVAVGPHKSVSSAKVELRNWKSVDGAWITKM